MSTQHFQSTSGGTRTRVYLALMVIVVLFAVLFLLRGMRPTGSSDALGNAGVTAPDRSVDVVVDQPSFPDSQPQHAPAGRLQRQPPGELSLTIPPEFTNPGARAAPTGDQYVHEEDWRRRYKPDPPLQPPVARASLTEIRPYQDWNVHQTAADSLGRIGVAAVPALVRTLTDPDPMRRAEAAWLLGKIGPEAKQAVPALVQALSDPLPSVQKAAARALGQIGPEAEEAVEALMRLVEQTEPMGVAPELDETLRRRAQ